MREVSIEEQAYNAENLTFGDDRLGVLFYMKTVEDKERTMSEGRRCFKEREFVKIMVPGDRHNIIDRPVQKTGILPTDDRLRFAKQWDAFQKGIEQKQHEGTPVALWPQIPAALAEELKFINIYTVEQLANLADVYVAKIPGGQQWKQKAQKFVQALKDSEAVNKLEAQLAERDTKISALEEAVKDQAAKIDALLKKMK
jgi:hypothetical protein